VLPGIPEINAPTFLKNRCDLMFIQDLDMTSIWGSFLFKKRAPAGMAVSEAMASMIDFMVYIGEKYYSYQFLGDTCERNVEGDVVGSKPLRVRTCISGVHGPVLNRTEPNRRLGSRGSRNFFDGSVPVSEILFYFYIGIRILACIQ
jgi:hypothetical protein